ncbi:MAG: transcription/translation regulatory transformer protein RfaH [Pseudomonadota bacterium]
MMSVSSPRRWYLLQCKPREVFRASEHLANQGFMAFVPTLTREIVRRSRRELLVEPLFPHYCFVHLCDLADNWAPIRSTRGVSRIVRFGDMPLAVPDAVVVALQQRESAGQAGDIAPQALFEPGQQVLISEGPLAGLQAVFSTSDGDERVILLLKILHQQQRVHVPLSHVQAVKD